MPPVLERHRSKNPQIGLRVRYLRTQRQWTQEALARAVGCTTDTITKLERGGLVNQRTLEAVAEVFDTTLYALCAPLAIEVA
jgi:transcriptional regulator with XRE-family HTH domain